MNPRAFIPLSLLCFGLLVAGLWIYLSTTEEPPPADWLRRGPITARPADAEKAPGAVPIDATPPTVARKSTVHRPTRPRPSVAFVASNVIQSLDDALVRWRMAWNETALTQVPLGWHELNAGRAGQALERFERLLRVRRNNGAAWSGKAAALSALGRREEAERAYRQAIRFWPRHAGTRYNFGVLLCRRSRFSEAAAEFREAVARDSMLAPAWYNLASLAQRDGRLSEAREAWERLTKLSPEDATAWYHLGVLWMDFEEALLAQRCFAIYAVLRPNDVEGHLSLAAACQESDMPEWEAEARATAQRLAPCPAETEGPSRFASTLDEAP